MIIRCIDSENSSRNISIGDRDVIGGVEIDKLLVPRNERVVRVIVGLRVMGPAVVIGGGLDDLEGEEVVDLFRTEVRGEEVGIDSSTHEDESE